MRLVGPHSSQNVIDSPFIPPEQTPAVGFVCIRAVDWKEEGKETERGLEFAWAHTTPSMILACMSAGETEPVTSISRKEPSALYLISGRPVRL